jgi:hypothetical protein
MSDVSAVVNHWPTAHEGFLTTLGSSILSGAATVPLTSTSGLTNGDIFVGLIEPSLTREQTFTGVVDTGGSQITGVKWTRGTNADHSAGVTIVDYVSGTYINMYTKGLLVAHNQDGTHKTSLVLVTPKITTSINDTNGNEVIKTPATASAVNEVTVTNAATGTDPRISATGGDTNIGLNLRGKGTGKPTIGSGAVPVFTADFVYSGCIWSGDAYASTRAASMTSGVVVINGNPLTVAAVTARTFTASKDTYVDFNDNGDGTAALTYTEVANNAASPALTASYLRNAIVVTGATTIAAAASINQGQVDRVLPIVSSVAYTLTDSLGNLICNRSSHPKIIGYRTSAGGSGGTTAYTGVSTCPYLAPANRNVKVTGKATFGEFNTTQANATNISVVDGGATTVATGAGHMEGNANTNTNQPVAHGMYVPAASGLRTLTLSFNLSGGFQMSTYSDAIIIVEV